MASCPHPIPHTFCPAYLSFPRSLSSTRSGSGNPGFFGPFYIIDFFAFCSFNSSRVNKDERTTLHSSLGQFDGNASRAVSTPDRIKNLRLGPIWNLFPSCPRKSSSRRRPSRSRSGRGPALERRCRGLFAGCLPSIARSATEGHSCANRNPGHLAPRFTWVSHLIQIHLGSLVGCHAHARVGMSIKLQS